jgi:NapC/NirT cytochrome c family, N-terminal region
MARDVRLIRSPLSVAGMVLTTISAAVFLVVFLADLFGLHTNPYIGILFFIVLPAIFLLGLVLIPLGAWVERRRRRAGHRPSEVRWPVWDLNNPSQRVAAVIVFALTIANVVIVSLAAYRGVEYMDSPEFCGQVCHQPMQPEWAAHAQGPHAQVACVECHVGPGATSFARSKLAGTRRVVAVVLNDYPRPIPPAVEEMRPARETCETCHWPARYFGDRTRRITEYADDDVNTATVTTLQMHVGGRERPGSATGIHWHTDPGTDIQYVTADDDQETISYVRVQEASGAVREYYGEGVTAAEVAGRPRHRMDCMDCHNRPSHQIAGTAEEAVNDLMSRGEIPIDLPFVHREAVQLLKGTYPTQQAAVDGIARSLGDFYAHQAPAAGAAPFTPDDVARAVRAVQSIARRSLFPDMHVTFGTYPSEIGHTDAPGCFRCHDDSHKTADGKTISQDCDTCHTLE